MNPTLDPSSFVVSLTVDAHRTAEQFRRYHSSPAKAKQVYLNTLAVYVTNFYLECSGLEPALSAGQSWNVAAQSLMDVADLVLPEQGRVECRPVLPDAKQVYVPPEVWDNRIGYIAVQFDPSLRQATILGFVDHIETEWVPLEQLHPLEELVPHLQQHSPIPEAAPTPSAPPIVRLSQWLEGVVDVGWQILGEFFNPPAVDALAFDFRINRPPTQSPGEQAATITHRSKRLTLETPSTAAGIVLLLGILPLSDGDFEIWVQVSPAGMETQLPETLELMILDACGEEVMQAQARRTEALQVQFRGELGEAFGIRLALEEIQITEEFVI